MSNYKSEKLLLNGVKTDTDITIIIIIICRCMYNFE